MVFVLILVVMEYGLRHKAELSTTQMECVLILVVMEYGLRLWKCHPADGQIVLILVVMEYGLRQQLLRICMLRPWS